MLKDLARSLYQTMRLFLFEPVPFTSKWRGLPHYVRNAVEFAGQSKGTTFRPRPVEFRYSTYERFLPAGSASGHYFHQDLWAARILAERGAREVVDVGSRVDGFVAHVLPFARVKYVDIRPLGAHIEGLEDTEGSILDMPFATGSVPYLSSLHVIEHVGLGRYADRVDAQGHVKAAQELARVLAPGGLLLLGTPVGRERVVFDAHRIFDPRTIVSLFGSLVLREFSLVNDRGDLVRHADLDEAAKCRYGCGLFVFEKAGGPAAAQLRST